MSISTVQEITCNLCGHRAGRHRFASPPICYDCPSGRCELLPPPPEPHPSGPANLHAQFVEVAAGAVDLPTAEAAWRLVLDAWRVVEVASARAGAPATPNRDEWMAALRVAVFRANYRTEPDPFDVSTVCGWSGCC